MRDDSDQIAENDLSIELSDDKSSRKDSMLGAFCILLVLGWAAVLGYSVHAALPLNAIKLPLEEKIRPEVWMPQGWKFFTRSPREDIIAVFRRDANGDWVNALSGPNASSANLFGISRGTRAQGIEVGILQVAVSRLTWPACKEAYERCVDQAPLVPVAIKNPTPNPTLCGELGLLVRAPVPWAWSRSGKKITMPSKAIRINVKC